ncbi:MAG: hypothetical protein Kow0074_16680 [Candidatus Zixiibacteriota bacterium]
MPTITALAPQKHRPGRIRVEIDFQYAFELSRKVVQNKCVCEGEELDPARRRELESIAAREAAIGLLARRERSRAELAGALKRKGFDESVINAVLDVLEKEKLQSDDRFASSWVSTRRRVAPRGRTALAYELKQRGIDDATINKTLREFSASDERDALRELIEARLRRLSHAKDDRPREKQRLLAFLARRGFAYEDIRSVLSAHFPDWA